MSTAVQVQYRRGTASQVSSFTGAAGEMVVDTTNNRVVVQDGSTAGGWPMAGAARVTVSDANYTLSAPYAIVAYSAITAARTVSLPASTSYPVGQRLLVVDESGSCSSGKTITLAANGSDTIDGAASQAINSAYGYLAIESNGSGKWTIVDQVGGGVSSLNAETGALTLAATDGAVVSAASTTVSIGGPGGMVNKFRDGTMDVWQRGTSLTATTSGSYTADGWIVTPTGASVTVAQAAGRLLTKNSLQVTGASGVTDVQISQRIESLIAAAFCSQTVTVQAQVYNSTGAAITPTLTVKRPSTQDGWSGTINTDVSAVSLQSCANGAWTLVGYTFSANAASYNGLQITFEFGNNFGANTKTVQITECDLRVTPGASIGVNTNPPPPELRPIATELALCLRYYYQLGGIADYMVAIATFNGTTQMIVILRYPPMRAAPSVSFTSNSQFSTYTFGNTLSSPTAGFVAPDCLQLVLTSSGGSGVSSGLAAYVYISSASNYIMLGAEL